MFFCLEHKHHDRNPIAVHIGRCIPSVALNLTVSEIHSLSCYGSSVFAGLPIIDSHVIALWNFAIELHLTFIDLSTTHKLKLRV